MLKDLSTLSIKYNLISTLDELKPLQSLNKLTILHLHGNPVCEMIDFPRAVFELLPSLQTVDLW